MLYQVVLNKLHFKLFYFAMHLQHMYVLKFYVILIMTTYQCWAGTLEWMTGLAYLYLNTAYRPTQLITLWSMKVIKIKAKCL